MLDGFWEEYRAYRDTAKRERVPVFVPGAGTVELYYSMSSVRASFRPRISPSKGAEVWEKEILDLAAAHAFLTDFRDDSYVLTNLEGVYYARLRATEFLFTPERFEEEPHVLEALVALYCAGRASGEPLQGA